MYRVRKSWEDEKSQIGAYESLENAKKACLLGYSIFDDNGKCIYKHDKINMSDGLQASEMNGMSEEDKIKTIAPLYQNVMKKTGMLASVGLAQFCLESGYGTTDLAQKANNLHGMKCSLSNNTWPNSTWTGESYTKYSDEVYGGVVQSVKSDFRKYKCCEDSIADRAAYFIGAKNGSNFRYPKINEIKDSKEQVELIKAGGYATDPNYVSKLLNIIERFDLDQYNKGVKVKIQKQYVQGYEEDKDKPVEKYTDGLYRVRESWDKPETQKGAYNSLINAKKMADFLLGDYNVYNDKGEEVYSPKDKELTPPYSVKITKTGIFIYKKPSKTSTKVREIEPGTFTIVEEKQVSKNVKFGKLKSGLGWIPLKDVEIIG